MAIKSICKCSKCGQKYIVWKIEYFINKHTFISKYHIEGTNKRGIAINHC